MNRNEPTWENQLYRANKLADEKGLEALYNPHAMIGQKCGCKTCFCCAALAVWSKRRFEKTDKPVA